jgi:predicted nucleic acid-binding protein
MMPNKIPIAVLDTNVLFPLVIRDLLLWYAHFDLFLPKWSPTIFDEWCQVMLRKGVPVKEALKRIKNVELAFPDALVICNKKLEKTLILPDSKDNHVLAIAIQSKAQIIITNNSKDFPNNYLKGFGIVKQTPDEFISALTYSNQHTAITAYLEMLACKNNPPITHHKMLELYSHNGLHKTVTAIDIFYHGIM